MDASQPLIRHIVSLYTSSALDIIMDWAVEIPVYQRQNCVIYSTERINADTFTPDVTTYYNWYADDREYGNELTDGNGSRQQYCEEVLRSTRLSMKKG